MVRAVTVDQINVGFAEGNVMSGELAIKPDLTPVAPMDYVSLHSHTTFSYGDGFGPVETHVKRVASLGMKALALTEHGNCSSWAQLEQSCKKHNIKPIFGIEIYFGIPEEQRKTHMILLAMNEVGLQNLNRIITQSWKQFYYYPTVYWQDLVRYNEGIIALSGCADSALSCILLGGKFYGEKRSSVNSRDYERAIRGVKRFQDVFGDRYYLEVQRFPGLDRTCTLNQTLEQISADTGTPVVGTCDVHYPFPNENAMQRILHAAHRGGSVETVDAQWEYSILLTYPKSDIEIQKDLVDTGLSEKLARQAISNSMVISDRCTVELPKAPRPRYVQGQRDWQPWL